MVTSGRVGKFSGNLIFRKISGNRPISKSLEVVTSIFFIRIADIPDSRAKNKSFFLNTMRKVIA